MWYTTKIFAQLGCENGQLMADFDFHMRDGAETAPYTPVAFYDTILANISVAGGIYGDPD